MTRMRFMLIAASVLAYFSFAGAGTALAQKNASSELIGLLSKQFSITPKQAAGGAGSLFGFAKTQLSPADFGKVSDAVPGMDGLLKAAPKVKPSAAQSALGSMGGMLPGNIGGLANVASQFKTLGLSPDMVTQFIPVLTQFVGGKGGADVAGLLGGVLK